MTPDEKPAAGSPSVTGPTPTPGSTATPGSPPDGLPPSHWRPRTRDGGIAIVAFLLLFAAAMPPITHRVLDRPEVDLFGVPFFFVILFVIYCLLIGVLNWTLRRGV